MGQSFCRRKKAITSLQSLPSIHLPKLVVDQCPVEIVEPEENQPEDQSLPQTVEVASSRHSTTTEDNHRQDHIHTVETETQSQVPHIAKNFADDYLTALRKENPNFDKEYEEQANEDTSLARSLKEINEIGLNAQQQDELNDQQQEDEDRDDSDVLSKKYYRYVYKSVRKPEIPTIDSTTLECSECSSDSSQGSGGATYHHITDTGLVCGEENDQVLQNIYFDVTTLKAKLNTEQTELRNISDHVRQRYQEFCQKEKTLVCTLNYVLEGLDLPDDATHLVVSFVTYHGDQFCVPYCLNHGEDPFPFEDPEFIVSALHDEELPEFIFLHCKNDKNQLVQIDVTDKLLYYSRDVFSAGFSHFRPYCWTWLSELSTDPEAILVTRRHQEDSVKYTSLTLYDPTINEWVETD